MCMSLAKFAISMAANILMGPHLSELQIFKHKTSRDLVEMALNESA